MQKAQWLWGALILAAACGCATNRITNLTPSQLPRSPNGLYTFEARWDSNQRSLRKRTLKGYVVIRTNFYPMHKIPRTLNRWEAVVPIPETNRFVNYRYKFEYLYNSIPIPRPDSKLSPSYQLQIIDRQ
ncbi:MAG: hypothetical protein J7M29_10455 [Verrucomicrobia bacterium]|nr:hypothetical protein [Verrucomicrobiota bacterium]